MSGHILAGIAVVASAALAGCTAAQADLPPPAVTAPPPPAVTAPTFARPAPPPAPAVHAEPAAPAPKTAPKTAPKMKPKYTCEPDAPARLVGNTIVNKDCGYVGKDGKQHSRDPWIEDQLRAARGLPLKPAPKAADPGQAACRAQKHWTTAQCLADAHAGNAS